MNLRALAEGRRPGVHPCRPDQGERVACDVYWRFSPHGPFPRGEGEYSADAWQCGDQIDRLAVSKSARGQAHSRTLSRRSNDDSSPQLARL